MRVTFCNVRFVPHSRPWGPARVRKCGERLLWWAGLQHSDPRLNVGYGPFMTALCGQVRAVRRDAEIGRFEPRVTGIMPRLRCWCIRPLPALLKHSCKTQHDAKRLHDGPSSVTGVDDLAAFCGQDRPDDPGHMAYARVIAIPVVPREMKWEAIDFERRGNTDEVAPVVRLE